MQHTGTLYLSRKQKPIARRAADGTFTLSLLAFDRLGPLQVEAYQLTWAGPKAQAFWELHHAELQPGAALQVELQHLRVHITTGRHTVAQLLADVVSLQILTKTPSSPCAVLSFLNIMTTPQPTPIDSEAIIAEEQKAAFFYDDINDTCPYPFGSLAAAVFCQAFEAARQVQNYGQPSA